MTDAFKPTPAMLVALRQAQWRSAIKGSVPMQILLGRLYLGQTGETPPASPEEIAAAMMALHEAASR
jgi:hypothetical protein